MIDPEARAQRLLRAYPRIWRQRYGDEFAALLTDDIAERPRCWRRDLNVVRSGLTARIAAAGLGSGPVRDSSATAATVLAAMFVFVAGAMSIWTQLVSGSIGTGPDSPAVTLGLVTLSGCGLAVVALAVAAAGSLVKATVRSIRAGHGRRHARSIFTTIAGATTFGAGAALMSAHAHGSALPARWTWAATESISTYWIHPGRLLALPAPEIAWMVASPLALIACWRGLVSLAATTGVTNTWHRLARRTANGVLVPALIAATTWVLGSQHSPQASLRAGSLDLALIAAMTAAVLTISAATRRHERSVA
ncbi:MAG: hypothetical protein QOC82_2499 [Frankiaceae bacterium]|jgi:hypothetical protein|nr:hypothetical protein [Frankiaceae bacterium]